MDSRRSEIRRLTRLALPVMGAQVGSMLMGVVDTVMLGQYDTAALAAAAIASSFIFSALIFGQGFVHGIDPIVTQAHGAGHGETAGRALQRGIVVALWVSVPLTLALYFVEDWLLLAGQDPTLAENAARYTMVQLPSIAAFLVFAALRQYLQGREIVRPAMWILLGGNLFNLFVNWILIFGELGFPEMGLLGAGVATTLSRFASLIALFVWVRVGRLHEGAWVPWRASVANLKSLAPVLRFGVPVAFQMGLEVWAFSASTLLAGTLGSERLVAHTIVLNMASLSFMMPLGISQAAVTRVGNLIGAHRPQQAQRAAYLALWMGAGVMTTSAVAFVLLRELLPRLYTGDEGVIALCATILPIAGVFQVFDGTQVVGSGILRGIGHTVPPTIFNLIGYWVLALPMAWWLVVRGDAGLAGLWWCLALGLATVALSSVLWVRFRGPARAAVFLE